MAEFTAQYLVKGLELGIFAFSDVEDWVDVQAGREIALEGALLDLTYIKKGNVLDAISLLASFPASEDRFDVLRRLLGSIPASKKSDKEFCRKLAAGLYEEYVGAGYDAPDDLSLIGWFDDEYDLAQQGIMLKSTDEWHAKFIKFLDSFKSGS